MKPSLADLAGYVADAFALPGRSALEDVRLATYTFVPWVRSGLSAALAGAAPGTTRATMRASITLRDDTGQSQAAEQTLVLRGPGDVIGLDAAQIVRRVPQRDAVDAEENFLAHIEFDRPELPWLFSPRAPDGDRLDPWLALVVCDASVSDVEPGPPGYPDRLHTLRGELQPLDDAWAWAHAQVLGAVGAAPPVGERLSTSHGPLNLSRILCPRRLQDGKRYIAALVPTFDCGRRSALQESGGTLQPAWDGSDPEGQIVLPAFDWWRFATAKKGDFEELAGRLKGVPAPWNVGRRLVDASAAGGRLQPVPEGAPGRVQVLRCALVSPTPPPAGAPGDDTGWDAITRDTLRAEVDADNAGDPDLPNLGARLYARFQRGALAVGNIFGTPPGDTAAADADWFAQLNTSPMHRIVAGLGTRVVQRDQESLMEAAWAQAGGIRQADETLVRMQFARYVGEALHRKHLAKLSLGDLAQVTRGIHAKVFATGSTLTLEATTARSAVAGSAMSAAFRRVTRLRGPLARFGGAAQLQQIVASAGRFRDFRRPYVELEGVRSLSADAAGSFSPELVGRRLGVDAAVAIDTLNARLATRSGPNAADALVRPVQEWSLPAQAVDVRARSAGLIDERIRAALPARFASEPARAEALAPLLVALGHGDVPAVARRARAAVSRIDRRLDYSATPRIAGHAPIGAVSGALRAASAAMPAAATAIAAEAGPRPVASLRFESAAARTLGSALFTGAGSFEPRDLALALSRTVLDVGVTALPPVPERPALALDRHVLLDAIAPAGSMTAYARSRFAGAASLLAPDWWSDGRVAPILWAPRFDRAMFEALADYDRDWLVPGIGDIAATDFVTVLSTNAVFAESFLIGLSDEMGRELLWRGYPTDQRGTYFHRFWSADVDDLAGPIHRFAATPLGSHLAAGSSKGDRIVLVIRGELVRRYDDVVVLAMRAEQVDAKGRPQFAAAPARVLFDHLLGTDIRLVGFDLGKAQIASEPWWFVIAQNPSGPRFGLDIARTDAQAGGGVDRNQLDWNDLGALRGGRFLSPAARTLAITDARSDPAQTVWPGHAGVVARTLLQSPIRAAFDARKLLAPALATP